MAYLLFLVTCFFEVDIRMFEHGLYDKLVMILTEALCIPSQYKAKPLQTTHIDWFIIYRGIVNHQSTLVS